MSIKPKKITYDYNADELKKMIIESLGKETEGFDINVRFNVTMDYGPMDRGTGSTVFTGVSVELTPKQVPKELPWHLRPEGGKKI